MIAKLFLEEGEIELKESLELKRDRLTKDQMPQIMESYNEKLDSLASMVR